VWLIGAVVCCSCSIALRHHWLLPINCHFLRLYSAAGRGIAGVSSVIEESDLYFLPFINIAPGTPYGAMSTELTRRRSELACHYFVMLSMSHDRNRNLVNILMKTKAFNLIKFAKLNHFFVSL